MSQQSLEEKFDGTIRRALSDFLIPGPSIGTSTSASEPRASSDDESDSASMGIPLRRVSVSHRRPRLESIKDENTGEVATRSLTFVDDVSHTELELARTPTCAIFHKSSSGNSVPHAFYAFIRQLTALPQLVVCVFEGRVDGLPTDASASGVPFRENSASGPC